MKLSNERERMVAFESLTTLTTRTAKQVEAFDIGIQNSNLPISLVASATGTQAQAQAPYHNADKLTGAARSQPISGLWGMIGDDSRQK